LFEACRKTRHELLLEIIPPREMPVDSQTVARALAQIYAMDVRPDWWKLPSSGSAAHWQAIQDTIRREDPLCRGVLLLGLAQPEAELIASFAAAAPFSIIKGFAIGRTIFHEVARAWFTGAMSDAAACEAMTANFSRLANAWQNARRSARSARSAVAI
jgi:5-dehydro-2-deoxygluconokinase